MVEIEIGVLRGQCINRRIGELKQLVSQIAAWEKNRNEAGAASGGYSPWSAPAPLARAYPGPTKGS
jgi:hypothetical protein